MPVEIPTSVIRKLVFFTFAMVILPVTTFFVCQYIFGPKYAIANGGIAALVANIVLIGYVVVAFRDDDDLVEKEEGKVDEKVESKKNI